MVNFVIFARLESEGYIVTTSAEVGKSGLKAKNVVFCAPPTGNNQYAEDVARAVKEVRLGCTKNFFEEDFEVMSFDLNSHMTFDFFTDLDGFRRRRSSSVHLLWGCVQGGQTQTTTNIYHDVHQGELRLRLRRPPMPIGIMI